MMMRNVPRKNISKDLSDIKMPAGGRFSKDGKGSGRVKPFKLKKVFAGAGNGKRDNKIYIYRPPVKRLMIYFFSFSLIIIVVFAGVYNKRKNELESSFGKLSELQVRFKEIGVAGDNARSGGFLENYRKNFDIKGAENIFKILKNAGNVYKGAQEIYVNGISLLGGINYVLDDWAALAFGNGGNNLITILKDMDNSLSNIIDAQKNTPSFSSLFNSFSGGGYGDFFQFVLEANKFKKFLDHLIPWLEYPGKRRILVFLYNSSEIRPGGGFLGSYAELSINKGSIESINVFDINEPDSELGLRTVPPKPLQAIAGNWRAADANWFFDFSDSARKTIYFLESSDKYKKNNIKFDGAIAVTPRVISDILSLTGPIDVDGTEINSSNFIFKIQESIQDKRAEDDKSPKDILKHLARAIIDRVKGLDGKKERILLGIAQEWFKRKDAVVYFKDKNIESFLDSYSMCGKIYGLTDDFYGDYLAVVNANIGGGKTDLFMKQKVYLQSQIGNDGVLNDHLVISRENTAGKNNAWWYKVDNMDYMKIFVPQDASVINASGTISVDIRPKINYGESRYKYDNDVVLVEKTREPVFAYPQIDKFTEYGRTVFASWLRTRAGKTSRAVFDYKRRLPLIPKDGLAYKFVFEKQMGVGGNYTFEISAPAGFVFKENNMPVYKYETNNVPARLILNLTLKEYK